jgi:hypothetical protein
MKFDHTPGPWKVYARTEFLHHIGIKTEHIDPISVAYGSNKEGEANARLIAAAPEMLEALIEECFTCGGICEINKCAYGSNKEGEANARLIAAAPEMLETLIEECFTCGGICEINKCDNCHRKDLLESATGKPIEEILKIKEV